jgi:2-isopropylmalate synthase
MGKIIIFDTTLRDGEQSPGASLNPGQKLDIAQQLARLKVDVIEAGFPISSPGDFQAVKNVAQKVKGPIICGLARSIKEDIDAAYKAVKVSQRPRIHVFLATSKIHMQFKLKKRDDEILRLAVESVKYAKKFINDVEFSPEDATRSEKQFLYRVISEVIKAGAKTVNIADTVGYAIPYEFGRLIAGIKENVPNIEDAVISVHCHNDLGLAVANSLAAVRNGARQVECTVNGIGERAGNASLEEIVMAINTRQDLFGINTEIEKKEIYKTSRMVSKLTGMLVQPNKAVVGQNAFRHEAGIHQDGVLKERTTYEIMRPEDVGFPETKLVLGKHSGRHAFAERLRKLGFALKQEQIDRLFFGKFKELADKKKEVYDEDLIAIVEDTISEIPDIWHLNSWYISSGSQSTPQAKIKLKYKGKLIEASSSGDGPVDACYKAIDKIIHLQAKLLEYSLQAITAGKDAMGEVNVKLKVKEEIANGRASSTDIVEASVKAYLNAINKIVYRQNKK